MYYANFIASDESLGDNNMWCPDDDSRSSDENTVSSVQVSVCEIIPNFIIKDLHFD